MSLQWDTAKHCHTALSSLFLKIRRQSNNLNNSSLNSDLFTTYDTFNHHAPSSSSTAAFPSNTPATSTTDHDYYDFHRTKRRKTEKIEPTNESSDTNPRTTHNHQQQQPSQPPAPPETAGSASNINTNTNTNSVNGINNPTSWNLSGLEDLQWPGGSASATNFDLNMTDLFHGTNWDGLFDLSEPFGES
jgi:hypothetical protein